MFPFSRMHHKSSIWVLVLEQFRTRSYTFQLWTSGGERPWSICTYWLVAGSMCCTRTLSRYWMVDTDWPSVAGHSWISCPVTWQALELCNIPFSCRDKVEVIQVPFWRHLRFTCSLFPKLYIQSRECRMKTGAKICGRIRRLHRVLASSLWTYKLDSQVRTFIL